MNVRYDTNGYSYDEATGIAVTVYYDGDGNAYDANSGDFIESISFDSSGQTVYSGGNGWNQVAQQIAQNAFTPRGNYPGGYPGGGINAGGTINRAGVSTGFNISPQVLMLAAGGVLIFLLAKGRR